MRVGAFLGFAFAAASVVPLTRCGTTIPIPPGDAATDADAAPKACLGFSATECPVGSWCFFPITNGCAAKGQCLPGKPGACQQYRCPCNWAASVACGAPGYVTTPVPYLDGDVCGREGCSGYACEACDVSGYAVTTMGAPVAVTNACTPTQMTDAVAACLGANATQQSCDVWLAANAADAGGGGCVACLFTLFSDAAWGGLVCDSASCTPNTPGCVDLILGEQSKEKAANGSGSCGDLLNAAYGCEDYACGTCSKTGTPGQTDYDNCEKSAAMNECKTYFTPTYSLTGPCEPLYPDAGDADAALSTSVCFPQSEADIPALLNVFCGTGP